MVLGNLFRKYAIHYGLPTSEIIEAIRKKIIFHIKFKMYLSEYCYVERRIKISVGKTQRFIS